MHSEVEFTSLFFSMKFIEFDSQKYKFVDSFKWCCYNFLRNKQFTGTINIMSILAVNTIYKHEKSLCNSFINFHFRMFVHKKK
jgi:hypothetical protein